MLLMKALCVFTAHKFRKISLGPKKILAFRVKILNQQAEKYHFWCKLFTRKTHPVCNTVLRLKFEIYKVKIWHYNVCVTIQAKMQKLLTNAFLKTGVIVRFCDHASFHDSVIIPLNGRLPWMLYSTSMWVGRLQMILINFYPACHSLLFLKPTKKEKICTLLRDIRNRRHSPLKGSLPHNVGENSRN